MLKGEQLEEQVYEPEHIQQVLAEIEGNFPGYFESFAQRPLGPVFDAHIRKYTNEQEAYRQYLSLEALDEFEYDPGAFKTQTAKRCPIIQKCLWAQDEVMRDYKKSFAMVTGRQLLEAVRNIAEFGISYVAGFDGHTHQTAATYSDLGLEPLNDGKYGCLGVIGYGIQSSLLYGVYARNFAHRSQDAVWSLYFLSGRKDFGLRDESEFLVVRPKEGTCEQNYLYPAELFGFYALRLLLMLKSACQNHGVPLQDWHRYIYLSRFCNHVAETHRDDINIYKRSSEHVESQPWF